MEPVFPRLEIFTATSGSRSARLLWANGQQHLLHSAEAPEQEVTDLPLPEIWGDVVLCLGTGLGYHLSSFREIARPLRILLCDCWDELLEAAAEKLQGTPHTVLRIPLPQASLPMDLLQGGRLQIIRHPASYRHSAPQMDACLDQLFSQLHARGGPLDKRSAPERVLLLHRSHFLQEELKHALEQTHTPFVLQCYEEQGSGSGWESQVLRTMQDFHPTMVFAVNMKGVDSEGILVDCARRMGVAVHCWFVDDPRPIALAYPKRMFPWIQAWCWERHYLPWLKQQGFHSPCWLPLAGDPQMFSPQGAGGAGMPELGLVFTGSAMGEPFLDQIRQSFLYDSRFAPLVEFRAEELLRGTRSHLQLLDGFPLPFQDERNRTWLECLIQHTASQRKRRTTLQPLVSQGLVCAGDPEGWRQVLPGVAALPDISYRHGLARHYQRSQINLNVTSCQMPTALNQRVFDVPLSGGFLLTDSQGDLQELFHADELAQFASTAELVEKSRWFLDHPQERQRIAQAARARILAEHTYVHRLRQILRQQAHL